MRLFGVDENNRPCSWEYDPEKVKPKPLYGKCILEIQLKNHGEYLRWQKYNGGRRWEFDHSYPAIMRASYEFHTAMDVEVMTKKIVQLLEMGFDVYSARWQVSEEKSQLKQG